MNQMYQVQRIVQSRINKKGKKEYLIKWVGYDSSQNTWEPEKNLASAKDAIDQFLRKEEGKQGNSVGKTRTAKRGMLSSEGGNQESRELSFEDFDNQQDGSHQERSNQNFNKKSLSVRKAANAINTVPIKSPAKPRNREIKEIKILGMNEIEDGNLIFKIQVDGGTDWVKKNFFIPDYMLDLIQFYESKILFKQT